MARMAMGFVALALVAGGAVRAAAQPPPLLVSGQTTIGILDGNGDGPGAGDCSFSATLQLSALVITPVQDMNFPLRACSGDYTGNGSIGDDSSSNFVSAYIYDSNVSPMPSSLPFAISAFQEVPDPDGEPPVIISRLIDGFTASNDGGEGSAGGAALCRSGSSITARITLDDGTQILRNGSVVPGTPSYLQLPGIPLERAEPDDGEFVMRNGYIPVTPEGTITMAVQGSDPFLIIDLARLQACSGQVTAPLASHWGIAAMLVALLVVTARRLGRSPAYSDLLPRI